MVNKIEFVPSFANDEEKMVDFFDLTKEEFLQSYSYLNEEEYEATLNDICLDKKVAQHLDDILETELDPNTGISYDGYTLREFMDKSNKLGWGNVVKSLTFDQINNILVANGIKKLGHDTIIQTEDLLKGEDKEKAYMFDKIINIDGQPIGISKIKDYEPTEDVFRHRKYQVTFLNQFDLDKPISDAYEFIEKYDNSKIDWIFWNDVENEDVEINLIDKHAILWDKVNIICDEILSVDNDKCIKFYEKMGHTLQEDNSPKDIETNFYPYEENKNYSLKEFCGILIYDMFYFAEDFKYQLDNDPTFQKDTDFPDYKNKNGETATMEDIILEKSEKAKKLSNIIDFYDKYNYLRNEDKKELFEVAQSEAHFTDFILKYKTEDLTKLSNLDFDKEKVVFSNDKIKELETLIKDSKEKINEAQNIINDIKSKAKE